MGNLLLAKRFHLFIPTRGAVTMGTNTSRWIGFLHAVKSYPHALLPIPMLALPIYLQVLENDSPRRNHNNCRWQFLCLWLSSKLWQHITYASVGRQNATNMFRNNIWMAPCESEAQRATSGCKLTHSPRSHVLRAVLVRT
jgi:hypothetical protein